MKVLGSCTELKRKPRAVSTFLKKTYELLNDSQNYDAVRWASNGVGFIITNEDIFSRVVLPRYFKHSNYSSFVRQLNMYNFHKIRENSQQSFFHHQHFDRNNRSAICEIKRKPEKKKKKGLESDDDSHNSENEEPLSLKTKRIHKDVCDRSSEKRVSISILKEGFSEKKVVSEKITQNIFQEDGGQEGVEMGCHDSSNHLSMLVEEEHKVRSGRMPRLATRELICASKNNLFPISIQNVQTSTLSIFYS